MGGLRIVLLALLALIVISATFCVRVI